MRIQELDALRGIAALAVVFYHYTTQYGKLFGHNMELDWQLAYGSFGVHLFFLISGFVIFLTIDRAKKPMDFVVSRFSRLYPTYWCGIILTTIVVWNFGLAGQEQDLTVTLLNFSMLQGVFEIGDVDGVYWTLMYELIFYLLILSIFMFGKLHQTLVFVTMGVCLNIFNSLVDIVPWKAQLFLLLQYNHLFGAGIVYYLLRRDGNRPSYFIALGLCLTAQWAQGEFISSVIVTGIFLIFTLFTYRKLEFLAIKPLIWLGSISYSLYLLHQNIGYVIIRELEALNISPNIAIFIALCSSLLLAHLVLKTVEQPSQKWIKRKYQSHTSPNNIC